LEFFLPHKFHNDWQYYYMSNICKHILDSWQILHHHKIQLGSSKNLKFWNILLLGLQHILYILMHC
jgi:hypothetical protein